MTCLGCQLCETGPFKTLVDGRIVCHRCEDWRAECEARVVVNMPTLQQRREYLYKVERARGLEAANKLKVDIRRLWVAARPAAGGG